MAKEIFKETIKQINEEGKSKNISYSLYGDEGLKWTDDADVKDSRLFVLNRDSFQCQTCLTTESLQIDHIIPRSIWALSHPINLQILCSQCNKSKGSNRTLFLEPILFKKNIENSYDDRIDGLIYHYLSSFYDDFTINLNNYGLKSSRILDYIEDVLKDKKMNMLNNYLKSLKRLPRSTTRWRRIDFAKWETY